ncbi:HAMP domain-containing histidine kinase [Natronomonas halophila]|nr:HAMP domain-containing histidine kinase [Natronomonas halophila]
MLMITGVSTIILYTGYELSGRPISEAGQWRALLIGTLVAGSFAVMAFAIWMTWSLDGRNDELSFLLSFATTLGAAVGTRVSLFAVESNEQLAETQELTKLLRINQRVLRHNLRNELSVVLGHLGNIERATETDDVTDDLRVIREHLDGLLETSDRTRKIVSIWDTPGSVDLELTSVIENQLQQVRQEYPTGTLSSTLPEECWVTAHPALPIAIEEALTNALEHNTTDVSVTVTAAFRDDDTVQLTIADTGTGLPETDREAITLPEETPLSHTRGLGLWILYWATQMSDGTIAFEDNDPTGTVVRITLPAASVR